MQRAYHFKYVSERYRFSVLTVVASNLYNATQLWWRFVRQSPEEVYELTDTYVTAVKDKYTYYFIAKSYKLRVSASSYKEAWTQVLTQDEQDRVFDVEVS